MPGYCFSVIGWAGLDDWAFSLYLGPKVALSNRKLRLPDHVVEYLQWTLALLQFDAVFLLQLKRSIRRSLAVGDGNLVFAAASRFRVFLPWAIVSTMDDRFAWYIDRRDGGHLNFLAEHVVLLLFYERFNFLRLPEVRIECFFVAALLRQILLLLRFNFYFWSFYLFLLVFDGFDTVIRLSHFIDYTLRMLAAHAAYIILQCMLIDLLLYLLSLYHNLPSWALAMPLLIDLMRLADWFLLLLHIFA